MKKILVVGMADNLGGVENVIINFYRRFDRKIFHFCFLINTEDIPFSTEILKNDDEIYKIPKRSKNPILYYKKLNHFFKKRHDEFDAIWCNMCDLVNIDYLEFAKKYNIKTRIIHAHTSKNMGKSYRNLFHYLHKIRIMKLATDFWACSNSSGKYFYTKKIINSDKYKIINNAIDTKKYEFNISIRNEYRKFLNIDDKIVLGNVGRLHFGKNQLFIIDILDKLLKINPKFFLILVGEGKEREKIEYKISKMHLESNVLLLGKRNDVDNMLQSFDFFIFPSLFEGLPVSLIEAQASGIDILASEEIFDEQYIFGKNIFFESLKNTDVLWADKIIKIMKLKNNRENNSIFNISEMKRKNFDLENEAKLLNNFLKEI